MCHVFVKPCGRNSVSEHALCSCGGESIATVRHIGIQHDGTIISALAEDKTPRSDCVNDKVLGHPSDLIEETEPNNLVISPFLECNILTCYQADGYRNCFAIL